MKLSEIISAALSRRDEDAKDVRRMVLRYMRFISEVQRTPNGALVKALPDAPINSYKTE